MYAVKRHHVKQFSNPKIRKYSVVITKDGEPVTHILPERISYVEEEVMQWRKAYHIHEWFVRNVQGGKDDGGIYRIPDLKLSELLEACDTVLRSAKLVAGKVQSWVFDEESPYGRSVAKPGLVLENDTLARHFFPLGSATLAAPSYDSYFFEELVVTGDWLASIMDVPYGDTSDGIYYYSR